MYRNQADRLSVILVPGSYRGVRRWDIRRGWLKVFGGVCVSLLLGGVFCSWGLVHYWHAYRGTEAIRVQNAQFDQERSALMAKLAVLEQVVERADRLAQRLETTTGVQPQVMTRGIGPIMEDTGLPPVPAFSDLKQFQLGEKGKQFALNGAELGIDKLRESAGRIEERLQKVYEVRRQKTAFWAALPTVWPVRGFVTSGFGYRGGTRVGGTRFHEGIDIASPVGTPVIAAGDGTVTFSGYKGGLGKVIVLDHGFGISTVYGHNAELYVNEGQRIRRGVVLAAIGMTGRTTGPHLHYEVLVDGVPVDPLRYLASRR